jgi:hypothetical protein
MYPFAIWGAIVASHHLALGLVSGFCILVALLAVYLSAWSAALGVLARHRRAPQGAVTGP